MADTCQGEKILSTLHTEMHFTTFRPLWSSTLLCWRLAGQTCHKRVLYVQSLRHFPLTSAVTSWGGKTTLGCSHRHRTPILLPASATWGVDTSSLQPPVAAGAQKCTSPQLLVKAASSWRWGHRCHRYTNRCDFSVAFKFTIGCLPAQKNATLSIVRGLIPPPLNSKQFSSVLEVMT